VASDVLPVTRTEPTTVRTFSAIAIRMCTGTSGAAPAAAAGRASGTARASE